ncbi:cytochrome P450 [bacterium RCC_150]
MARNATATEIDIFTEDAILNPHEYYRQLRDRGAAIWMDKYDCWVLPRHREVKAGLEDHGTFSSGSGVCLNGMMNDTMAGSSALQSDPPAHTRLRRMLGSRLTPRALNAHKDAIQERADALVSALLDKGSFDVVADFSLSFPISVVPDLLGCPADGRDHLLKWASAAFQATGPMNERTSAALPALQEFLGYTNRLVDENLLSAGGWGDQMLQEARAGEIDEATLPLLLVDYLGPSIDTTTNALSVAIWKLGEQPDQWRAVRRDPTLINNIVDEAVRFEAPIRGFSRLLTSDFETEDGTLPAGDRVFFLYGSANRDERFWQNPNVFDVTRDTTGHVGFGGGIHRCVGQGLAKLEAKALFTALVQKVSEIEVGEPEWGVHNILRGISRMPATLRG